MPEWMRSGLLLVMIVLIVTGRRSGAYDNRKRLRVEQAGLRAALLAELAALRAVYRLNLDLIAAGAPQIVSGGPYFSVYRGHKTRLIGLSTEEVAAIITAHAACETLDAAVQIGMRMRARRTDTALWDARGFDLWSLQGAAQASAEQAAKVLQAAIDKAARAARRTVWQRLLSWLGLRHAAPSGQRLVATDAELQPSP